MAKPVITDKPIIDQAEFNGITIWRKEGGSIEVSDTNYPSMKAAIYDIASKAFIVLQDDWNTQYAGWYLIQELKKNTENPVIDHARFNHYTIIRRKSGSIEIQGGEFKNTKAGLREISVDAGIDVKDDWNTQYMGWYIIQQLKDDQKSGSQTEITPDIPSDVIYISLKEPGTLEAYCEANKIVPQSILSLSLHGKINEDDSGFIGNAFESLQYLDLRKTDINEVWDFMFDDCVNVETIILPSSVTSIKDFAFRYCKRLNYLNIPSNVTDIDSHAFENCISLNNLTVSSDNPCFKMVQNCLVGKDDPSVILWGHGDAIPEGMNRMEYGFFDCGGCTSLSIPDSFFFTDHEGRPSGGIYGGLHIENKESLVSVHISDSHPYYIEKGNSVLNKDGSVLLLGTNTSVIPGTVRIIGHRSFLGCKSMNKISIPERVEIIDELAFYGCKSLAEVIIPKSVKEIRCNAFYECKNLKQVVLSDGLESIGNEAFGGCESLESLIIPSTVTSIGKQAFGWCYRLQEITLLCHIPPQLGLYGLPHKIKLVVPKGTKEKYMETNWSENYIEEML